MAPKKGFFTFALLLFILFSFNSGRTYGQNNDFEAGLYNVGVGSVIGGIGAIINKNPNEKLGDVLFKGMYQGALGGYLVFESKRLVRIFSNTQDFTYVWPSKLVNSAGSSIIANAAANRDFWEKWHLSFGFNRIEITTKENFHLSYRVMPMALAGTILTATRGDFNLERSLKTGTFVFLTDRIERRDSERGIIFGQVPLFGNSILILDTWEGDYALAHEIIHTYQNESFSGVNQYVDIPHASLKERSKFYRLYSKIFYTDYNSFLMGALYNLETQRNEGYKTNIFEKEAFYFTDREWTNPGGPIML